MGPPSSGGLAVGQILGMIENRPDLMGSTPLDVDTVHLFTQAGRLTFLKPVDCRPYRWSNMMTTAAQRKTAKVDTTEILSFWVVLITDATVPWAAVKHRKHDIIKDT